ncbi:hypothetical protein LMG28690_03114 [Paraburkholderia caffeinilytica]|nr:hypothetical protein LMG28690_03114 [Paraburkholderia caffeinilytica]
MNTSILVGGATGSVATERLLEKGVPARDPKILPTFEDSWVVPRQLDMTSDASVKATACSGSSAPRVARDPERPLDGLQSNHWSVHRQRLPLCVGRLVRQVRKAYRSSD